MLKFPQRKGEEWIKRNFSKEKDNMNGTWMRKTSLATPLENKWDRMTIKDNGELKLHKPISERQKTEENFHAKENWALGKSHRLTNHLNTFSLAVRFQVRILRNVSLLPWVSSKLVSWLRFYFSKLTAKLLIFSNLHGKVFKISYYFDNVGSSYTAGCKEFRKEPRMLKLLNCPINFII